MTVFRGGLVIAAARSGSGKTIVTLGLMRALARRGLKIAGLKNGPDYIDPAFHAAATGLPSFNIDTWAMPPDLALAIAGKAAAGADLVLCEGSMGLFDGVPAAPGLSGSSADTAALLGWPVLLVHDCSGQSQSAAALLAGLAAYDKRLTIAGVILNRIGSERHARLVREAVSAIGLKVFGAIPRSDALSLPERHLGLVQAGETADLDERLDALAQALSSHVDLDAIVAAASAGCLRSGGTWTSPPVSPPVPPPGQRIAIARDAAFSFLYPHVLDGWRRAGAELAFFSPLADEPPSKDADCCWLPGGYPELHAARLAAASLFLSGLREFAVTRPVHGECGGYMVLGRALTDAQGRVHAMAGLLSVETSFAKRRMTLGYRDARILGQRSRLRGHEFHYATVIETGGDDSFAEVLDAYGAGPTPAGSRRGNVTGSFFHVIASA